MLKRLNSKLENLFDQNSVPHFLTDPTLSDARKNFREIDNNLLLENLSYVFCDEVNSDQLQNLFTQLCLHFEIGLLVTPKLQNLSLFGKNWPVSEKVGPIKLPATPFFKIFKSESTHFLNHFNLRELDPAKKMASYLVRFANGHYFLFLSATAEPWAKLRVESLQKTLMKINFSL